MKYQKLVPRLKIGLNKEFKKFLLKIQKKTTFNIDEKQILFSWHNQQLLKRNPFLLQLNRATETASQPTLPLLVVSR